MRSNKGIEGLAYDRAARTLYAAQEKSPKRIYRIRVDDWLRDSVPPNLLRYELEELWVPLEIHLLGDISGLHFDDRKRQLLVLSDESKRLIAIDMGKSGALGFAGIVDRSADTAGGGRCAG